MINGSISEFIDQLYYGQEIVFIYEDKKYFIQGWWDEAKKEATMVLDDVTNLHSGDCLWKAHNKSMIDCAEAFLSAKIWNGKDFIQIEKEVIWTDW